MTLHQVVTAECCVAFKLSGFFYCSVKDIINPWSVCSRIHNSDQVCKESLIQYGFTFH